MRETVTSVATASGDLRAIVRYPGTAPLLPGIVLVDGSGEGAADNWGQWPAVIGGCGAVVLAHDKPGSGGSPGDWRDQTFADRACESLAALEVLRKQPGVDPGRLGFLGISQGGWVSYLAACMDPQAVSQVVAISGPGVSVAEQERYRIALAGPGTARHATSTTSLNCSLSLPATWRSIRPPCSPMCAAPCSPRSAAPTRWCPFPAASPYSASCCPATRATPLPSSPPPTTTSSPPSLTTRSSCPSSSPPASCPCSLAGSAPDRHSAPPLPRRRAATSALLTCR